MSNSVTTNAGEVRAQGDEHDSAQRKKLKKLTSQARPRMEH